MQEKGEKLLLLNDKELELNADDLVITDSEGAVALAGVMAERKIRSCRRRNA